MQEGLCRGCHRCAKECGSDAITYNAENKAVIDYDKCKNCKSCMRIGCPALVSGDKCITIDNTLCVGCGLCEQLCKFDAIKE